MFHQVEGLWIDEHISFADLKGVYTEFLRRFFERDELQGALPAFVFSVHRAVRRDRHEFRRAAGSRSRVRAWCTRTWCATVGIDGEKYRASRSASGLERLTMLRYGVDDLRLFFESDLRFLRQFN